MPMGRHNHQALEVAEEGALGQEFQEVAVAQEVEEPEVDVAVVRGLVGEAEAGEEVGRIAPHLPIYRSKKTTTRRLRRRLWRKSKTLGMGWKGPRIRQKALSRTQKITRGLNSIAQTVQ